jgi:hypothetical protein
MRYRDVMDKIGEIHCDGDVTGLGDLWAAVLSWLVIRTKSRPEGGCRLNSPPYNSCTDFFGVLASAKPHSSSTHCAEPVNPLSDDHYVQSPILWGALRKWNLHLGVTAWHRSIQCEHDPFNVEP